MNFQMYWEYDVQEIQGLDDLLENKVLSDVVEYVATVNEFIKVKFRMFDQLATIVVISYNDYATSQLVTCDHLESTRNQLI